MHGAKMLGAAVVGLIAGAAVGFVLSEALGIAALLLGGGELPGGAPLLKYLIVAGAGLGVVGAPMLVARRATS